MIVDKLKCLALKLPVNHHNILFANCPFVIPQDASNAIFVLELLKLCVKGDALKFDKHAVPLLQTIELVLPDLELLCYRCETLLLAEAKQITNVNWFHLFKVVGIDACIFAIFHQRCLLLLGRFVVLLFKKKHLLILNGSWLATDRVRMSFEEVHDLLSRDFLFKRLFQTFSCQHPDYHLWESVVLSHK